MYHLAFFLPDIILAFPVLTLSVYLALSSVDVQMLVAVITEKTYLLWAFCNIVFSL